MWQSLFLFDMTFWLYLAAFIVYVLYVFVKRPSVEPAVAGPPLDSPLARSSPGSDLSRGEPPPCSPPGTIICLSVMVWVFNAEEKVLPVIRRHSILKRACASMRTEERIVVGARRNIIAVWCLFAGLLGCAAVGSSEILVYEDSRLKVSVVPDPSVDASDLSTRHDHPMQLASDQVFRILSGVGVERSRGLLVSMVLGPHHEAAFSREDLTVLAPKISIALSRASSKDRVSVVLSRMAPSKTPETLEWALWGQGGNLFVVLTRHQLTMAPQQAELSSALQGGATRGPGVARDLPGDLAVGFSSPEYVVALEPTLATQLFGNPHAHVVIDYRRFLANARPVAQISDHRPTLPSDQTVRAQDRSAMPTGEAADGARGSAESSRGMQALSERVKTLETQVNDLLGVVKQLTKELAESNRALTARDEEIRTLKGQVKPAERQRKPSAP